MAHLEDSSNCSSYSFRSVDSLQLLANICCRDQKSRQLVLDNVLKTVDGWIEGYGSPPERPNGFSDPHRVWKSSTTCPRESALEILPDILRLSIDCPYADVRERCGSMLSDLKDRGVVVPRPLSLNASSFIHPVSIKDIGEEKTSDLLMEVFLHNNRLEHMFQVMSLHPQYLECFLRTHHYLLREGGPLPNSLRHYIAIMAASSYKCSYLVNLHIAEFLTQGGDDRWLKGLNFAPEKIQRLAEINRILAHRPWLITVQHIKKLVHSDEDRQHNWSMSELMHAIVLLVHFHSLASFVFGCGIASEIDHPNGHTFSEYDPEWNEQNDEDNVNVGHQISVVSSEAFGRLIVQVEFNADSCRLDSLVQTMQQINDEIDDDASEDESYDIIASQNAELLELTSSSVPKSLPVWGGSISRFIDDPSFVYQDFCRRDEKSTVPTFRNRDFSWEDHGFSLAERLYMDIGALLDEGFTIAQNLTYKTLGNKQDVDTRTFRRAVWNYIHSLFGIRHDDYNYSVINQLLEQSFMMYIKLVTCFPDRVTAAHYHAFMQDLKPSEKVHLNIVLLEAKLQAELLYVFRAVSQYLDGKLVPMT